MMKPINLAATAPVDVAAESLWRIVSDCRLDTHWRRGVLSMEQSPAGPVKEGSSFTETLTMMGQRMRTKADVVDLEPGTSYRWTAVEGADVEGRRTVRPDTESTSRVDLVLVFRPRTLTEKIMRPLFAYMLGRTLDGDVRRLKAYAEAAVASPRDASSRI